MPSLNDFDVDMKFSKECTPANMAFLLKFFNAIAVRPATHTEDKAGIDFWVTLRDGSVIGVDVKNRKKGCSHYWQGGMPDLCLEVQSTMPEGNIPGSIGWTLNESTNADYIMFRYHQDDYYKSFVFPFQIVRLTFSRKLAHYRQAYGLQRQFQTTTGRWAQSIFVPVDCFVSDMKETMCGGSIF